MAEYHQILKELQSGKYAPIYFLQGEESFFIDSISNYIEANALEESQKGFNQLIMYGRDSTITDVIGAAKRYPMMGERQVVIVKEAQEMRDWRSEEKQILFISYLENPLPSTILVLNYKNKAIDKRTKIGKLLAKKSVFMSTKKIYENQVQDWVNNLASAKGLKINQEASMLISENIGTNLERISNELEKLRLNIKEGETITGALIEKYVGISKDYNIFELQKAIGMMDKKKALKIVNYFASNSSTNPLVLILGGLFSYFSKLLLIHSANTNDKQAIASMIGVNPYFAQEYIYASKKYPLGKIVQNIKWIENADLQAKGIGSAPMKETAILQELVYKLMN